MLVKIEENTAKGNPLKNGAKNWLLEHLPEEARTQFMNAVVPCTWKKLSTLEPWANLTVDHVKKIVDEVFGKGTYQVKRKGPWMGLVSFHSSLICFCPHFVKVNAHIHNYHNGFIRNTFKLIVQLIEDYKDELNTKEAIAAEITCHLEKDPIGPGADPFTYAYQWKEWSMNPKERKVSFKNDAGIY